MNTLALALTIAVALSSTLLITAARRAGRGPGGPAHDLFEVAFLNGGPGRVVDTALAAMQADGRLVVGGPGIVAVQRPVAHDPVERAVLQEQTAAPSGALHTLRAATMRHAAVQEIGDGLASRGLLAAPGANRTRGRWGMAQGLLCLLGVPAAVAVTIHQFLADDYGTASAFPFFPKVFPALLAGAVIGFVCVAGARSRVTKAGRGAASEYRTANASRTDPAHLVATFGPRALPDPELRRHLLTASRTRPAVPSTPSHHSSGSSDAMLMAAVWCAGTAPGGGGCGSSSGHSGGGGGSGCGSGSGSGSGCGSGSGSGCGSSGSSCGSSGSSCGSSGSSCGSSS